MKMRCEFFLMAFCLLNFAQARGSNKLVKISELFVAARKFVCKIPQPRAFLYSDLFKLEETEASGIIISVQPRMVVLHRCDAGSGCCLQDGFCSPETTEKIDLAFTIFNNSNRGITTTATVTNHTSCSCQAVKDLPK